MADTITSLLSLARQGGIDTTGGRDRRAADLCQVLAGCVAALGPAGERVDVQVPAGLAVGVPGELAARALQPLLENAARMAGSVSVTARRADSRVEVLVTDDGPGVPEELRDALFTPGVSAGGGGSGLGLALARRVARSLGGDARLVRPVGPTVFAVELPAAAPDER
ncbi:MAG: ATP-binding protein [Nocardioides sp.]